MKKEKTNRQVLMRAVKNLSDIDLVFFRERLITATKDIIDNEKIVKENMENSFLNPELIIDCCKNIYQEINFDN